MDCLRTKANMMRESQLRDDERELFFIVFTSAHNRHKKKMKWCKLWNQREVRLNIVVLVTFFSEGMTDIRQ